MTTFFRQDTVSIILEPNDAYRFAKRSGFIKWALPKSTKDPLNTEATFSSSHPTMFKGE